ncbi:MAG: YbaN family protein [Candidatus Bipolaricaulota bacterium]|nr:YbaN family protein [Candidatus Bipolaricaulota bacterium]
MKSPASSGSPPRRSPRRGILALAGLLCLGLAILGWVLPIVPATPFLLLAAWLFARSSPRLHRWLRENRLFGRYLRDYADGRGLPWTWKVGALVLIWSSVALSLALFARAWWLRLLILGMAAGVSWYLLRLPTPPRNGNGGQ